MIFRRSDLADGEGELSRALRTGELVAFGDREWPWWLHKRLAERGDVGAAEASVVENSSARRWTTVGDLGGPTGVVDPVGMVGLRSSCSVDWAVGTGERWYHPARESAVRQRLVGDGPVVETAVRVPRGDVVHRVAAVGGDSNVIALEVENTCGEAIAVGLGIRPVTVDGAGAVATVSIGERRLRTRWLEVEFDRPIGAAAAGSLVDGEPWRDATAAGAPSDAESADDSGWIAGAAVVAVPHHSTMRAVIRLAPEGATVDDVEPSPVPELASVATGWSAVLGRGATVELPDPRLTEAWRRAAVRMVIVGDLRWTSVASVAAAAVGLDRAGLFDEADRARTDLVRAIADGAEPEAAVLALAALASRRLRADEPSGLEYWAGHLAAEAGERLDAETLADVALALRVEAPAAADDAERLEPRLDREVEARAADRSDMTVAFQNIARRICRGDVEAVDRLLAQLALAHDTGSLPAFVDPDDRRAVAGDGDDVVARSALLEALGALLVDDTGGEPSLRLFPVWPDEWRGQPVDVRDLPTRFGMLSFSVRWHGERPALLWEFTARSGRPVELRCAGLDPEWSTTEPTGEALLTV